MVDTYPTVVLAPDGTTTKSVRVIVDESPSGQILVRFFGRVGDEVVEVLPRLRPVMREGARRHGRFTMADGSIYHYSKVGGCGCSDSVRSFDVPAPTDADYDAPVPA